MAFTPFVIAKWSNNMRKEDIEARAEALITPMIERNGFELVDVEYVKEGGNYFLRAYIDNEGGITIDDCELISREFSTKLDEEDFIDDSYTMEISSPGLGRPLKKEKDYVRAMGQEVDVKTYTMKQFDCLKRKSKEFTGQLSAYDKDSVTITDEDNNELTFQKQEIALIRLAFDF